MAKKFRSNSSSKEKEQITKFKTIKKGRRKKNSNEKGGHDKNEFGNIVRKFKSIFLSVLLNYINKFLEKNNIKKKLFKIIDSRALNISTSYNKELLLLNLKQIFSLEISKKNGKNIPKDYNIKYLDELYKNPEIKKLLDCTFEECLNHFRGSSKENELLKGLKEEYTLEIIKLSKKNGNDYVKLFKDVVFDFEIIYRNKNIRYKDLEIQVNENDLNSDV